MKPQPKDDMGKVYNIYETWQDYRDWLMYGIVPAYGLARLQENVLRVLARAASGDDQ